MFYYNFHGEECEPKHACLVSEEKLPDPDPNFCEATFPVPGRIGIGEMVNFAFGSSPRILAKCQREYYSNGYKDEYPETWIKILDQGTCFTKVFSYMGKIIWIHVHYIKCF